MGLEPSPRNQASDRACEAFHLLGVLEFMRAEREHPGRFSSPEVVREDHRRLVGAPTTRNAAEFVDQLETSFDLTDRPPVFRVSEVIAVRGDLYALIRCRVTFGDQATEFLNVFRNHSEDAIQRSVLFDPGFDAAFAELDLIQQDTDVPGRSS